jgi:steroid 5-alpha reductase family enzyme
VDGPTLFATALALCAAAMFVLWLVSLALRDASIVDIWWGPGFALIAAAGYWLGAGGDATRRALATSIVVLWGSRLGGYLAWRNLGHGEDPRYQAMRRRWGSRFPLVSLGTVFGLQCRWRYTRHPNYFGDCCVWWGLYAIAAATPLGVWTIASPVLMTFLLLRVSGVALLERSIGKRRPDYAQYAARTSAFVPRPPRRIA